MSTLFSLVAQAIVGADPGDPGTAAPEDPPANSAGEATPRPPAVPRLADAREYPGTRMGDPADRTAETLLADLHEAGWGADRIRILAAHERAQGNVWPYPVDSAAVAEIGYARWHAILADLLARLGETTTPHPPSQRTTLDADERRLIADAPPHFGNLG